MDFTSFFENSTRKSYRNSCKNSFRDSYIITFSTKILTVIPIGVYVEILSGFAPEIPSRSVNVISGGLS